MRHGGRSRRGADFMMRPRRRGRKAVLAFRGSVNGVPSPATVISGAATTGVWVRDETGEYEIAFPTDFVRLFGKEFDTGIGIRSIIAWSINSRGTPGTRLLVMTEPSSPLPASLLAEVFDIVTDEGNILPQPFTRVVHYTVARDGTLPNSAGGIHPNYYAVDPSAGGPTAMISNLPYRVDMSVTTPGWAYGSQPFAPSAVGALFMGNINKWWDYDLPGGTPSGEWDFRHTNDTLGNPTTLPRGAGVRGLRFVPNTGQLGGGAWDPTDPLSAQFYLQTNFYKGVRSKQHRTFPAGVRTWCPADWGGEFPGTGTVTGSYEPPADLPIGGESFAGLWHIWDDRFPCDIGGGFPGVHDPNVFYVAADPGGQGRVLLVPGADWTATSDATTTQRATQTFTRKTYGGMHFEPGDTLQVMRKLVSGQLRVRYRRTTTLRIQRFGDIDAAGWDFINITGKTTHPADALADFGGYYPQHDTVPAEAQTGYIFHLERKFYDAAGIEIFRNGANTYDELPNGIESLGRAGGNPFPDTVWASTTLIALAPAQRGAFRGLSRVTYPTYRAVTPLSGVMYWALMARQDGPGATWRYRLVSPTAEIILSATAAPVQAFSAPPPHVFEISSQGDFPVATIAVTPGGRVVVFANHQV